MTDRDMQENKLVAERRRKLNELRAKGFAFPNAFRRTALAEQLHQLYDAYSNETLAAEAIQVQVGGRMMTQRVMGKASFATIRDRSGNLQLFLERDALPEGQYAAFKTLDLGDIVGCQRYVVPDKNGRAFGSCR